MKRGHAETETPDGTGDHSSSSNSNGNSSSSSSSARNGDEPTGAEHSMQPYKTFKEVHDIMVSLKSTYTDEGLLEASKRALNTLKSQSAEITVRQLSARLAMQLCAYPAIDALEIAAELAAALGEAGPSLRYEIYQVLGALHESKGIFASVSLPSAAKSVLSTAVLSDLNHAQHHLRCASLSILTIVKPGAMSSASEIFDAACRYSTDAHPKVRQAAMNTILRQHMMGVKLPVELYDECVVATKDDSEQVRLIAIELVWAISSAYPEYPVVINRYKVSETIRLLDDAFVKICDMVNDNSVIVRQRACTILGRFKDVDSKFLSQTFSKQVMSNLRRYVPRGMRESTRRNQGIKTRQIKPSNIPTPEGDVDVESDEFKLLDSGAAGAFVHGLEDEFQEVRDAAIESITELSVNSTEFAAKAVDFLVDMFNDSSDSVRLRAIHALLSIGERALIQLTDEQLSIALSAMKDANSTVRKGIYAFLAVSVLAKSEWLAELMAAIKASLEKYPEDQLAIYKATKSLGFNHSAIVSVPFVRGLLGLSEHYLSREARIDDIVYAGKVILIMNTKPQTRQLLAPALPEFVFNHLPYLRDKYVGCLPENISDSVPAKFGFVKQMLKRPAVSPTISQLSANDDSERLSKAQASIRETLAKISSKSHSAEDAANHTLPSMLGLLTRQIQKLDDLKQSQTTVSTDHSAGATESYARVIADVLRIQSLAGNQLRQTETLDIASRIMYGSYAIEARTVGLDPGCRLALVYLRLFAHAAWLHVHSLGQYDKRLSAKIVEEFAQRARRNNQILMDRSVDIAELAAAVRKIEHLSADNLSTQTDAFVGALLEFVKDFRPLPFVPAGLCQHTAAEFQALAFARRTIEFNHIFPVNLAFTAVLSWLPQRQGVLVLVKLPTQQIDPLRPPPSAFKPSSRLNWTLEWSEVPVLLPLSSGEETSVEISIAVECKADVPWSDHFVVEGEIVPASYAAESYYKAAAAPDLRHVRIVISNQSHKVSVNPVQFRPPQTSQTRA